MCDGGRGAGIGLWVFRISYLLRVLGFVLFSLSLVGVCFIV